MNSFIKYEFWANVILAAKKQGVVLLSVATLLRKNQVYFKFYGGFFRQLLQSFDYFFVQNKSTFDLLQSIEIEQVVCVGDTRFDRVLANRASTIEKSNHSSLENEIFSSFWKVKKPLFLAAVGEKKRVCYLHYWKVAANEKSLLHRMM